MTRRPAGVIFAAIFLGIAAALLFLFAVGTLFSAFMMGRIPVHPTTVQGGAQLAPMIIKATCIGMAVIYLALSAWAITTLVGLVRMRSWARISVMIISGGVAVLGILSGLLFFAMPVLVANTPMPPNANMATMRNVFIVMAVVCLVVAAIGIFWLVYFSLRSTRGAFLPGLPQPIPAPASLPYAHTLNFDAAEPMPSGYPEPVYTEPVYPQPHSNRPISVTIIAILFLAGSAVSIPCAFFFRIPLMICGVFISGTAAHIVLLALILWTIVTGIGLLMLQKPAWYMAMAYYAFGIVNTCVMLLPGELARMGHYMQAVTAAQPMGMPPLSPDLFGPPLFHLIMLPSMLFGIALIIFLMILLWRARWVFHIPTSRSVQAAQ